MRLNMRNNMENLILKLKERLILIDDKNHLATDEDILSFENRLGVLIPEDLKQYFKIINGNMGEYDDFFFSFNSLFNVKNIDEEFKERDGLPDYTNLVNVLQDSQHCFVFCDYEFHLFSYAIRLYNELREENEIYVLCGDKYKIIANSFTSFLELYFERSDDLLI
jgi:hypothetical protein